MSRRASPRKGRKGLGGAWSKLSTKSQTPSTFSPFVPTTSTSSEANTADSNQTDFESSYYSHPFRQTSTDATKVKERLTQFKAERSQQHQEEKMQRRNSTDQSSSRPRPYKSLTRQQRRPLESSSSTSSTPPRVTIASIDSTSNTRVQQNIPWENDFFDSQLHSPTPVTPPTPSTPTNSTSTTTNIPTIKEPTLITPTKPLKSLLKPSKRGLTSSSSPSENPWISSHQIRPFRPPHEQDDDDDNIWRKDGQSYRSQLVQLDDDNGGRQFVINKEENLVNYFEISHRVSVYFAWKMELSFFYPFE